MTMDGDFGCVESVDLCDYDVLSGRWTENEC